MHPTEIDDTGRAVSQRLRAGPPTHSGHLPPDLAKKRVRRVAYLPSWLTRFPLLTRLSARGTRILVGVAVVAFIALGLAAVLLPSVQRRRRQAQMLQRTCGCPAPDVCTSTGTCVACVRDNDCPGSAVCRENVCRATCTSSSECPSQAGRCVNGACVECVENSDCGGSKAVCFHAVCVDCLTSQDCPNDSQCLRNQCKTPCMSNTNGNGCPIGTVCDLDRHFCVECLHDSQCGASEVCNTTTGKCVQCTTDANCDVRGPNYHCNTVSGTCVRPTCVYPRPSAEDKAVFLLFPSPPEGDKQANPALCAAAGSCSGGISRGLAPEGAQCIRWMPCDSNNNAQWFTFIPSAAASKDERAVRLDRVLHHNDESIGQKVRGNFLLVQPRDAEEGLYLSAPSTGIPSADLRLEPTPSADQATGFTLRTTLADGKTVYLDPGRTKGMAQWVSEAGGSLRVQFLYNVTGKACAAELNDPAPS